MLTEKDYTTIFLNAGKHLNTGLLLDYFEGSFNKNKRTESSKLFIHAIENVYNKLKQKLLHKYYNDLTQYQMAKVIEPNSNFEKPKKEYYQIHCSDYDWNLTCKYNLTDIENIYRGFLLFQTKIEIKQHFDESDITKQTNNKKAELTYHWQGSADELTNLYSKMMASKLIAQDAAEADFKAIFEAKPLNGIEPIKWIHRPVLLAYFIDRLREKVSFGDDVWHIAEKSFLYYSQKTESFILPNKIQAHLSSSPKNHDIIDGLFLP